MGSLSNVCSIVGIGETDYLVNSGRDPLLLALEAIRKAVDDAGLEPKDIDGIVSSSIDASGSEQYIASNLGLSNVSYTSEVTGLGGAACATVAHAAMAVASGMANTVVCFRAFTPYDFTVGAKHNQSTLWAKASGVGEFLRPFGWSAMVDTFAMNCRRHMHEYGTTSAQLGAIAVAMRKHASMNPASIRSEPITLEDHQNSPFITQPLRELDGLISNNDGACAMIVTTTERARDLRQKPAKIMAAAQSLGSHPGLLWELSPFKPTITESEAASIAPRLYAMAGLTPQDIDVAQIYDCYTYTVLTMLEDYGFCEKGEGGSFVEGGRIEIGGELPVNTHGGHLGEAYIHGFTHIVEGVKQMRGTSTAQVEDAETTLVASAVPGPTSALILGR